MTTKKTSDIIPVEEYFAGFDSMKNEFSVPLPETKEQIDKIKEINSKVKKSAITSLYFALPVTCPDNTGFEQLRTYTNEVYGLDYYLEKIAYAKKQGFEFIYLLNSPRGFIIDSDFFKQQLEKLNTLIVKLRSLDCRTYRVCNPQLITHLEKHYPDLNIYASTSLEYKSLKQYSNFLNIYQSVEEIVPAVDLNKNFKLLKNLRKKFPHITVELMVNEGCLHGCPLRYTHNISIPLLPNVYENPDNYISQDYFIKMCTKKRNENLFLHLCNHNVIYPWEIEEYNKLGIRNFKLAGRAIPNGTRDNHIQSYLLYLLGIDSYKNIENEPINIFNLYLAHSDLPYKVKDVRNLLPNINHFKKNGHLCQSICGMECKYCYKCAEKIKKLYENT